MPDRRRTRAGSLGSTACSTRIRRSRSASPRCGSCDAARRFLEPTHESPSPLSRSSRSRCCSRCLRRRRRQDGRPRPTHRPRRPRPRPPRRRRPSYPLTGLPATDPATANRPGARREDRQRRRRRGNGAGRSRGSTRPTSSTRRWSRAASPASPRCSSRPTPTRSVPSARRAAPTSPCSAARTGRCSRGRARTPTFAELDPPVAARRRRLRRAQRGVQPPQRDRSRRAAQPVLVDARAVLADAAGRAAAAAAVPVPRRGRARCCRGHADRLGPPRVRRRRRAARRSTTRGTPTRGGFARNQKGTPDVDETGAQIAPQNVIVQFVTYHDTGYTDVERRTGARGRSRRRRHVLGPDRRHARSTATGPKSAPRRRPRRTPTRPATRSKLTPRPHWVELRGANSTAGPSRGSTL